MRIIVGRASARYTGRISAELTLGDVVILIRDPALGGDGSLLLFDRAKGIPPRNWMPAGSEITEADGVIVAEHPGRGERLEIYLESVESDFSAPAQLQTTLAKLDTEEAFSDLLASNLEMVDEGIELVGREYRTAVGPVDIMAREAEGGRPVVVEVKRRRSSISDAYQLRRYLNCVAESGEFGRREPRGILVAPHLARGAKEFLDGQKDLTFVRLDFEQVLETEQAKHKQAKRRKRSR